MSRCYSDDIPDEVPDELMDSLRAPSYKAIAICLLKNDFHLYGLGFQPHVSHWYKAVKSERQKHLSAQRELL